ncbi:type IX secretion/gliding motility protein PorT/SprT [Hymenobacter weizhouensis]|uniref:type IX secretion/gliding motility protein PorT/SprT n=1 Tax=Hymenobacter sp. YIM 151500-1 TaxID=2987689 RepID=UPI00222667BC|nr:porin family protein [Hymenobacter sp. YIM 151500-1]UYZ64343.1 PorT family protein [Hymenobacter sp. YIM 151500-1]
MATPHVRHQLHLHRAKVARLGLVALAALALPLTAQAQRKSQTSAKRGRNGQVKSVTVNNLPGYDDRWLHLGLYVAPNFSRYKIEQAPGYPDQQGVSANSTVSPGFSVGFLGDLRIADYLTLTFTPGVSFLTRRIDYKDFGYAPQTSADPETIETQEVGTTQLDLPVLFKIKSERRRNTRVYIVGGVNPNFTLGSRRTDEQANVIRAGTADVALEYGVGLDLFYPYFKFSPELRFSHGLTNLHQPGATDVYTRSLQSMKSNTVTLYLNIWSGR